MDLFVSSVSRPVVFINYNHSGKLVKSVYQGTNGGAHQKPNLARYISHALYDLQVATPLHINIFERPSAQELRDLASFLLLPPVDGPFHYPLGMLRFVDFSL